MKPLKPKKLTDVVYLCKCFRTFHVEIDGKPDFCPSCKRNLDWS